MITPQQAGGAVAELSAIPYFPREEGARTAIIRALCKFVADLEKLRWLVDAAVSGMPRWTGVADLRALYGVRWKPADGFPTGDCSVPGFTPDDCEAAYQERQIAESQQKFLPAPDDTKISDEEREQIAALDRKVKAQLMQESAQRSTGIPSRVRVPKYLEEGK